MVTLGGMPQGELGEFGHASLESVVPKPPDRNDARSERLAALSGFRQGMAQQQSRSPRGFLRSPIYKGIPSNACTIPRCSLLIQIHALSPRPLPPQRRRANQDETGGNRLALWRYGASHGRIVNP